MIKFGTDGWRAIIGDEFTVQNVRYCAQALAEHLLESGKASRGVIVGYDTRFASGRFAAAASEVMAGNGIAVRLCSGITPTPVISYGVLHYHAAGAIVITASHNPAEWNGFKIKSDGGAGAPPEMEKDIEKRLPSILDESRVRHTPLEEAVQSGTVEYVDLYPAYAEQIARLVDLEAVRRAGLKVAVDSMFGAGSGYFRKLLGDGKTEIIEIHSERNPLFPGIKQPEPIAANLSALCEAVRSSGASVGLATDGDADRIGVVDEKGHVITPLQVFGLLALYLLEIRGQRGPIVKTINTTDMARKLGEMYDVPVFETKVGFKHVAPIMEAENALVSGEESGSFGFRGHIPERDGILSGLLFLDMMVKANKKPSEMIDHLYRRVGPHHYHRTDVEFPATEREAILGRLSGNMPGRIGGVNVAKVNTMDGYHFRLEDGSWLLIRFSGTEPLLRIYAEAGSLQRAIDLVAEARTILRV